MLSLALSFLDSMNGVNGQVLPPKDLVVLGT